MAERTPAADNEERLPSSTPIISTTSAVTVASSSPQISRRSSARQAKSSVTSNLQSDAAPKASDQPSGGVESSQTRKRKAPAKTQSIADSATAKDSPASRSKRQKLGGLGEATTTPSISSSTTEARRKAKGKATMGGPEATTPAGQYTDVDKSNASSKTSSRPRRTASGREVPASSSFSSSKLPVHRTPSTSDVDTSMMTQDDSLVTPASSSSTRIAQQTCLPIEGQSQADTTPEHPASDNHEDAEEGHQGGHEDEEDEEEDEDEDNEDDDPFGGFGPPGLSGAGLSSTLRALTGMMAGLSGRLRDLLNQLRSADESIQLIGLQDLSEILLVSNEDNLSGHFSPDSFVKELIALMAKDDCPEIMLLACRCLANLMEALPASVANVVYGGAVPVLCQKLLEIAFIDLAEQALSTLEKISVEYPSSIVREGGLTACLSYLDFFPTSTQRTAVNTAANCCRNISEDSFPVVRDVMPILLNVLNSSDQRVVEKASLCVTGIVESFKYHPSKLEELVSVDLLRAILRLLVPGTTNLIGSNIHTQFLKVLAFTARASPWLSAELFKLNVVETLYQILTGVSPPSGTDDVASKLDSVVIMQALIHRPREQIVETLNVICEILPSVPESPDNLSTDSMKDANLNASHIDTTSNSDARAQNPMDKRLKLLEDCKDDVRRFVLIIFPTLTDTFSSTVNLSVRQKVLTAQLKMLSNLDQNILLEALVPVPYASFLASILSQQDHSSLVISALQAAELLLKRLDDVYRYQFYREGVVNEIEKLANQELPGSEENISVIQKASELQTATMDSSSHASDHNSTNEEDDDEDEEVEEDSIDEDHESSNDAEDAKIGEEENEDNVHREDMSPVSSRGSTMSLDLPAQKAVSGLAIVSTRIRDMAKQFLKLHESEGMGQAMKEKADNILKQLSTLASEIEAHYLKQSMMAPVPERGRALFTKLASYFDADVLESVTSAELQASSLVRVLLEVFSNPDETAAQEARSSFLEIFMGYTLKSKPKTATADSPATPFSVMVHKLQDLLSRSEHFEVITVHQHSLDGSRSSAASMLGKQIRLKLIADSDSNIPGSYRNIMVSIHAIATFKSLDDYLRPRISLSERPRASNGLSRALAAISGSMGLPLSSAAAAGRLGDGSLLSSGPIPPPPPPMLGAGESAFRTRRKSKSKSTPQLDSAAPSSGSLAGPSSRDKEVVRRSSRKHTAAMSPSTPKQPPISAEDEPHDTLECADEKQFSDDDPLEDSSALQAIVGQLDEDLDDEPMADPSAVSMEMATSGRVTARRDDGTRVATPAGSSSRFGFPPPAIGTPTPAMSTSRPMSYASAAQAPPDWHIEFSVEDKQIPLETTIYRAVHTSLPTRPEDHLNRSIWSATHSIKFRRVAGPPPSVASIAFSSPTEEATQVPIDGIPASLAKSPSTAYILRLLDILHGMNTNIEDVLVEDRNNIAGLHVEPLSQFVNTKLTAKLNRQLEEPLIVASNCLPSWSEDLARLYPFLFPFETRHLFLQSTSFGYARSMARWQSTQTAEDNRRDRHNERPFLGRLQRQKVRISRHKILESALKVMDLYGASQSIVEVEYFEEVGTGLGPTLEFYSTVSKEFSKKKLKLWRETDSSHGGEFVTSQAGLFPRPLGPDEIDTPNGERVLHLFRTLGKFVARSMIDSRIVDVHLNPIFFRIGDKSWTGIKPSLGAVKIVDSGLARSLKMIKRFALAKREVEEDPHRTAAQKVVDIQNITVDNINLEDLCLDFTLPGYSNIELVNNGSQKRVDIHNVNDYLEKVIDMTLGSGVKRQVDAFRAGFSQVFPYSALSAFTPDELVALFGKSDEDWSLETLLDSIKADHGYNMDSRTAKNLLQTMSELDLSQRRDFLQFTTGSPKLPIGGFKSLTPMFTVVCKPSEAPYVSDDYLPSVMTCVNYLKLPDYSSAEVLQKQLYKAMKEGQGAFHLS